MTDNAPTPFVIAAVALFALGLLIRHIIRTNQPTRPANTNSARWEPNDFPPCDWVKCPNRGTNHVTWVRSGVRGNLCPGHRDEAVTKRRAVDTWDEAAS